MAFLEGFFNGIFGGLIGWSISGSLLVISFIMSLIVTLVYKWTTDQELMKSLKAEIKDIQKKMREFKDSPEKMMELQKPLKEKTIAQFKHGLRPTLYTFLPFILLFGWMKEVYSSEGAILLGLSWIWIYIISSIIFGTILRKILRVH